MARVSLENVSKRFGRTEVLGDLTLSIENNALTVLVGPSGCGKSTILRIIAGLEEPSSGDVYIDGRNVNGVAPFRRGVGMVFQSYALYPHMTVYDNLRFGLTSLKLDQLDCDKRIREAAELLSLTPYLQRKPKELSGGQRQRVAMGRALVRKPSVFLFDEPLSNLDASLRTRMRLEIARLRESLNATAVYVTHDQVEAMTLANKIVVLRAGRIEQEGAPLDVYHHPVNKFVAGFLGSPSMNFIPARVAATAAGEVSALQFPDGSNLPMRIEKSVESNEVLEFGIRPEHLTVDPQLPAQFKGRVFALEKLGDQTLAHISLERKGPSSGPVTSLIARLPGDSTVEPGENLNLGFDPSHAHVFAHSGESIESRFSQSL